MNERTAHVFLRALAAGAIALLAQNAQSQTLYSDTNTTQNGNFNYFNAEAGNQVVLAGTSPSDVITNFEFQFDFIGTTGASGNETADLRIYANNGPLVSGYPSPGTVLFDSGPFNIGELGYIAGVTATFNQAQLGGGVLVPQNFTWTVTFAGLTAGENAGLALYSPATIGTNFNDAWVNAGSGWQLDVAEMSYPPLDFAAIAQGIASPVLYSDTNTTQNGNFNYFTNEAGNEVVLAGASASSLITNFEFQFDFIRTNGSSPPSGFEKADLRIYANNGPLVSGYAAPGTVMFDSGPFNIGLGGYSSGETAIFNQAALNGGVLVPQDFTWTVTFSGLTSGETAGLALYSPATIGTNFGDAWVKTNGSSWRLDVADISYPPLDFAAVADGTASPVLYSDTNTFQNAYFTNGNHTEGNEVVLAGQASIDLITNFTFQYDFTGPGGITTGTSIGGETADLRFYANYGSPVIGYDTPGTLLYDSGSFSLGNSYTSGQTVTFNQATLDGGIVVPQDFTWTVTFSGLGSGESAGLALYSPPTIGANYNDAWINDGSGWLLDVSTSGNPPLEFGSVADGSASAAPLTIQLSGANVVLTWGNPAYVLQSASVVNGPYTDVPGAPASPYTTPAAGLKGFFQLRLP
jgi:hypothetical protein